MSRLDRRFAALRAEGRKALIPFVTAGDPGPGQTVALMHAMVAAGASVIELGIPFSDPMADGPVIQRAAERALAAGMSMAGVLEIVRDFRRTDPDTPVILMGYLNPIEVMGYEHFATEAARAGADGVITVDLPPEEAGDYLRALNEQGLAPIFLVAPTTPEGRIRYICENARGFVYYVSMKGVTGASHLDMSSVRDKLQLLRRYTELPVGIGFGIKDRDSARAAAQIGDAVVVGSAVVARIEEFAADPEKMNTEIAGFLRELADAMSTTT